MKKRFPSPPLATAALLAGLFWHALATADIAIRDAMALAATQPLADKVLVLKSERRLLLLREGAVLKEIDIVLGQQPEGHKQREGDLRTPEGRYMLDRRNPNSDFFLSIRVSYPDANDVSRAARNGVKPGGQIMIHGLPNDRRYPEHYYLSQDWTEGCIAVSDADMIDIWLMTRDNTPIEIRP